MKNFKNCRKLFPILEQEKIIYFDSAGTSLKPKSVINVITSYYNNYGTNPHNHDSKIGYNLILKIEETRNQIRNFINAKNSNEIIFLPSTSFAINQIAYGLKNYINEDDEIVVNKLEHSSNLLPWYNLCNENKAKIKYMEINNFKIDINSIKKVITNKTKIVSFANVTNILGYLNDTKEIIKEIKKINKNVIIVVDAAQSIVYYKNDVQEFDVDFLVFSAHKIFGPTGIAVMYGKFEKLNLLKPFINGGGMNFSISNNNCEFTYHKLPLRLEGGTPNSAGILGMGEGIEFIQEYELSEIRRHVHQLRRYAINKMKKELKDRVIFYGINDEEDSNIILFNIKNVFSQDVANHLGTKNIIIRSGQHCSKLSKNLLNASITLRISLCIYNTENEIDKFVNEIKNEKYFLGNIV